MRAGPSPSPSASAQQVVALAVLLDAVYFERAQLGADGGWIVIHEVRARRGHYRRNGEMQRAIWGFRVRRRIAKVVRRMEAL